MPLRDLNFGVNSTDTSSLAPNDYLQEDNFCPKVSRRKPENLRIIFIRFVVQFPSLPTNINFLQYFIVLTLYRIYREAQLHLNLKTIQFNFGVAGLHDTGNILKRRFHAENASNVFRPPYAGEI